MKPVESALNPTNGYIKSFTRNTQEGWWEIEIGLPVTWVFDENSKIGSEITFENEVGKLVKIFPKKSNVVIDDLINFVEIIIITNEKIAEKEKQFTDKMQEMKGVLEQEAKKFYKELDELKENSFKKKNENFTENLDKTNQKNTITTLEKPKTRKPRAPRVSKKTNTVTENTEVIESPDKK